MQRNQGAGMVSIRYIVLAAAASYLENW